MAIRRISVIQLRILLSFLLLFSSSKAQKGKTNGDGNPSKRTIDRNRHKILFHRALDPTQSLSPPVEQTFSTGLFHTCTIIHRKGVDDHPNAGPIKCWGNNDRGQSSPPPGVMFTQVSCGGLFTCGMKVDGKVVCWGEIDHPPTSFVERMSEEERRTFRQARRMQQQMDGQIMKMMKGIDSKTVSSRLHDLSGGGSYIQVSSGRQHACALSKEMDVVCWGRNDYGESSPPNGLFVQISAGQSFTCGIRTNGAMECWGKNDMGQSSPPDYPRAIFQQVSASIGGDHACGILVDRNNDDDESQQRDDGQSSRNGIRCWGDDGRGQSEPQDGYFLHVSAGARTTCGILADTSDESDKDPTTLIHCWGSRANALLEHLVQENEIEVGHDNYFQINLGQDHACAISTMTPPNNDNDRNGPPFSSGWLNCWWIGGTNFGAHHVPLGLVVKL